MNSLVKKLKAVKAASQGLRSLKTPVKNKVLTNLAELLLSQTDKILKANQKDLKVLPKGFPAAYRDRLTLNASRIKAMCESLLQVAALPDPVGQIAEQKTLKNGLSVKRVRSPLGLIFMIFESRPNVAIESFSLAFKAGNAVILRGGKESISTTQILYNLITQALSLNAVEQNVLWGITEADRKIPQFLLKQKSMIDVVVPRGGDGLINYVVENSLIPIIKNDRGLCHVYVHGDADLDMALAIIDNAKTSRPGVCNSLETILLHESIAPSLLPRLYEKLSQQKVLWFTDQKTLKILGKKKDVKLATTKSWDTEYLDFKINCRLVKNVEEAIAHIEEHGSRHSESICTSDAALAAKFQSEVDAAVVYWNASTRFTDGFELGLGGELGISTQKIHVRGPVGLNELTSLRWVINGTGQVRI